MRAQWHPAAVGYGLIITDTKLGSKKRLSEIRQWPLLAVVTRCRSRRILVRSSARTERVVGLAGIRPMKAGPTYSAGSACDQACGWTASA